MAALKTEPSIITIRVDSDGDGQSTRFTGGRTQLEALREDVVRQLDTAQRFLPIEQAKIGSAYDYMLVRSFEFIGITLAAIPDVIGAFIPGTKVQKFLLQAPSVLNDFYTLFKKYQSGDSALDHSSKLLAALAKIGSLFENVFAGLLPTLAVVQFTAEWNKFNTDIQDNIDILIEAGETRDEYQKQIDILPGEISKIDAALEAINDPAVILGVSDLAGEIDSGQLEDDGAISYTDPDKNDDHVITWTYLGTSSPLGTFNVLEQLDVDHLGVLAWNYDANDAAISALDGEVTELYRVTIDDQKGGIVTTDVSIVINGDGSGGGGGGTTFPPGTVFTLKVWDNVRLTADGSDIIYDISYYHTFDLDSAFLNTSFEHFVNPAWPDSDMYFEVIGPRIDLSETVSAETFSVETFPGYMAGPLLSKASDVFSHIDSGSAFAFTGTDARRDVLDEMPFARTNSAVDYFFVA